MFLLLIVLSLLCGILGNSTSDADLELKNQHHISKRIVGGSPIEIDSFPWIASIQTNNIPFCSGSILTNTTILTAAHCTTEHPLSSLSVRVGSSRVDEGGSVHKCVNLMVHENFTDLGSHSWNDVALLTVDPPIQFSEKVTKVILPSKGYAVVPGMVVRVAGWGQTSERGPRSQKLMAVSLLISDNGRCAYVYGDWSGTWMDSHGLICTDATNKDVCTGDSGGPLMAGGIQIGIILWGRGCARRDSPNVSVNVAVHRDWINGKIESAVISNSFFLRFLKMLLKYGPMKWDKWDI